MFLNSYYNDCTVITLPGRNYNAIDINYNSEDLKLNYYWTLPVDSRLNKAEFSLS